MVASTIVKLTTYKYADVSTAHITARDNTILGELRSGDGVREDDYGYWIYVSAEDDQFEADLEGFVQHGLGHRVIVREGPHAHAQQKGEVFRRYDPA